jgi:type I restriction enzyme S subunit
MIWWWMIMTENKFVPKRRFKEFKNKEAWEQYKLIDIKDDVDKYSYTGGPFGSDLKSSDYTENGVRIIQLQNIGDGEFLNDYKIYTSERKAESLKSNLIYPGEIIIAKMAEPLARAAIMPLAEEKYLMASDGIRLKVNASKFDVYFIVTLINSNAFRKKALINSTGTTRKRIGLVTLGNLSMMIPNLSEQQKIGSFFKQLDNSIALHQQMLEKMKSLKSSYLSEMLPTEGKTKPKRRFKGFTNDWEQRKLGKHTDLITKGTTPKEKTEHGTVNFVKVENISNGSIYPITKINEFEHNGYLKRSKLKENDILLSIAGTLGRTAIVNKSILPANTNQALAIIRGYEFDTNFLLTSLVGHAVAEYIRKNPTVGAQPNLSLEQVGNLQIKAPSLLEQQKIGTFFKQLDDIIALHQCKLEKLQNLKKAYLNEMLV